MRVWILAKEKNFKSYENRRFQEEAEKMGIELQLVAPEEFDIIVTREGRSLFFNGSPSDLPDCLIPRMGAGTTYFALAVIRHLEKLGVFVLNSSQSIEAAKDKLATLQILAANNIPIPKTMLAKFPLNVDIVEKEFNYPLIVKTVSGSHGKGVFLCENRAQLEDLLGLLEISKDPKVNLIIQEFVSSSKGRDIRVFVVGGRAIGAMLRKAKGEKFKANFSSGGEVSPFNLNPAVEWLAVESAKLLGLDIAGVDVLFNGDSYMVCEVNSSPGFEGFEKATGINVPKVIFDYVRVRLGIS
ncbi:alpha-L-glutamate ligase, RimK family [Ferroglobus placidus DSM 10642]|uniref:Alpha-L-glutamate ligase, RimK family n=1 Tax=Ferroglobus placidus (strain DSM 10642 / AEDII12DO) TaxID=589924 RepID=D3S0R0_FERPA|nr:RimK family alpha-L-glutamate ligase [Ferroglobus placidus]ADC66301.1 alpha-L-glutamate ligase, RimK family [Ferroglobus placidus DSM 10642]